VCLVLVIFAQFGDLLIHAECVVLVVVHVERGQDVSGVEWCNTTHINLNAQFGDLLFHAVVPSLDLI
jgi:hypothetical protein